jgi:molybdopterin/thiamine biosynthesis adenylyltransferase
MLQELINRNEDLRKLQNEGYELEERGGYLIIHHIPYVANINEKVEVKDDGAFVVKMNLSGNVLNKPFDHTIFFIGEFPCNMDGTPLMGVVNNSNRQDLGNGIIVNHYLSNKPVDNIEVSYFNKVVRYESIISRPAMAKNSKLSAKTFKPVLNSTNDTPFKYIDTWSSRYDIQEINNKLCDEKIAIIGLGGTGSYILDFLSKTPVKEIHLFDGDKFCTHNAFRAPGAPSIDRLNDSLDKVKYFANIYSNIREGIIPHNVFINEDNIDEILKNFDFVFICIDNEVKRNLIVEYLALNKIPFIDTGIGLYVQDSKISGQIRTLYCFNDEYENIKQFIPQGEMDNNEYKTNIQVAELNALNAIFAIIKWKQTKEFYCDLEPYFQSVLSINDMILVKS